MQSVSFLYLVHRPTSSLSKLLPNLPLRWPATKPIAQYSSKLDNPFIGPSTPNYSSIRMSQAHGIAHGSQKLLGPHLKLQVSNPYFYPSLLSVQKMPQLRYTGTCTEQEASFKSACLNQLPLIWSAFTDSLHPFNHLNPSTRFRESPFDFRAELVTFQLHYAVRRIPNQWILPQRFLLSPSFCCFDVFSSLGLIFLLSALNLDNGQKEYNL